MQSPKNPAPDLHKLSGEGAQIDCGRLEDRVLYSATPISPEMLQGQVDDVELPDGDDGSILDLLNSDFGETHDGSHLFEWEAGELEIEVLSDGRSDDLVSTPDPVELIFVDQSVENYQQLIGDLQGGDDCCEIVLIDSDSSGVEQISRALEGRENVAAIHIVSHGSAGQVQLGDGELSADSLNDHSNELASWQEALADDADVLFYGCNLAADEDGQDLISAISDITGADVAASDDLTGHADLGGDWEFEYYVGEVETDVAFSLDVRSNWEGTLATFTVTNTDDDGSGSLREAIEQANATAGIDTIEFAIVGGAVNTIELDSALPAITEAIIIDGWSDSDYGGDGVPVIIIDGSNAGIANGLNLSGADGSTVRGLSIINFELNGVRLDSDNTLIYGNYIGVEVDGVTAAGNALNGILLMGSGNTIGTNGDGMDDAFERNVIGDNDHGILISGVGATSNVIAGNYIGVGADGSTVLGHTYHGIQVFTGAANNTIGGSTAAHANVISGQQVNAIHISGADAHGTIVQGNLIGTSADGLNEIGNAGDGININAGADNTSIVDNLIAGSGSVGVEINGDSAGTTIQGNIIGTDAAGTQNWGSGRSGIELAGGANNTTVGGSLAGEGNVVALSGQSSTSPGISVEGSSTIDNTIRGNSVFENTGEGIDLSDAAPDGLDGNDVGDSDTGGNTRLNVADLVAADVDGTDLHFILDTTSLVSGSYTVDFYANDIATIDVEAERYLGSVSNVASGLAAYDAMLSGVTLAVGESVTITVTDATGNTSELSTPTVVAAHVNDSPGYGTSGMTVDEAATATLTNAMLNETDSDDQGVGLEYTITTGPVNGYLAFATDTSTAISNFTQQDIDDSLVVFVHDGSETIAGRFFIEFIHFAQGSLISRLKILMPTTRRHLEFLPFWPS
ncbi:MAG: DUF4347 domain-containing protein, partial [Planctomycetota bacterium]